LETATDVDFSTCYMSLEERPSIFSKQTLRSVLNVGIPISRRIFSADFPSLMLRLYATRVQILAQHKAVAFLGGIQSEEWDSEDL